ncbi:HNH endonuclease [Aliiroseovarius crassostreae]
MWLGSSENFCSTHSISRRLASLYQCTAEHLVAASEGGPTSPTNIVAACKYCNSTRHRAKRPLSPDAYKNQVRSRLKMGKWPQLHPPTTALNGRGNSRW